MLQIDMHKIAYVQMGLKFILNKSICKNSHRIFGAFEAVTDTGHVISCQMQKVCVTVGTHMCLSFQVCSNLISPGGWGSPRHLTPTGQQWLEVMARGDSGGLSRPTGAHANKRGCARSDSRVGPWVTRSAATPPSPRLTHSYERIQQPRAMPSSTLRVRSACPASTCVVLAHTSRATEKPFSLATTWTTMLCFLSNREKRNQQNKCSLPRSINVITQNS